MLQSPGSLHLSKDVLAKFNEFNGATKAAQQSVHKLRHGMPTKNPQEVSSFLIIFLIIIAEDKKRRGTKKREYKANGLIKMERTHTEIENKMNYVTMPYDCYIMAF